MSASVTKSRLVEAFEFVRLPSGAREKRSIGRGVFHGFGSDCEEFNNGAGNYSTAIVELEDGTVICPRADMIRFIGTITS